MAIKSDYDVLSSEKICFYCYFSLINDSVLNLVKNYSGSGPVFGKIVDFSAQVHCVPAQ